MFLQIVKRIDELKQRLSHLRCQRNDAMTLIAIEAVEQELARTAARLPREWDLVSNQSRTPTSTKVPQPAHDGGSESSKVLKITAPQRG